MQVSFVNQILLFFGPNFKGRGLLEEVPPAPPSVESTRTKL